MPLDSLPPVRRLLLATVRRVPQWHPEHAGFRPFPVHAWLVHHPDGNVLVDTGIGAQHPVIDEWYDPVVTPVAEAPADVGLAVGDITAVVLTHLHFDHCGRQRALEAPVHVQADERAAAADPAYTVAEWAAVAAKRLRVVRGDEELAPGLRLLATPGHSPGHQSVVVEGGGRCVVLGGQCAFHGDEVTTGVPSSANLHDESWRAAATASPARIRALAPCDVELSHDPAVTAIRP